MGLVDKLNKAKEDNEELRFQVIYYYIFKVQNIVVTEKIEASRFISAAYDVIQGQILIIDHRPQLFISRHLY